MPVHLVSIVFKERIYKIWKQFTTRANVNLKGKELCSKNEYTKSESNSQLVALLKPVKRNCVQRTNIQNLKAIHNCGFTIIFYPRLCSKNEYTKSESNSQLPRLPETYQWIVFKERIYKIWKQFTTASLPSFSIPVLCSKNEYTKSESNSQLIGCGYASKANCVQRTNIQNLKAIHNR